MSRYIGALCRLCRREGHKLLLKGERCRGAKCAIAKERPIPGVHAKRHHKLFGYNNQLRTKQKMRRYYGISETQFKNVFDYSKPKKALANVTFKTRLETRLDNVIFLLKFAHSRMSARQIVTHGHIKINNRRVNYPSFILKIGDVISLKKSDRTINLIKKNIEICHSFGAIPKWILFDKENFTAKIIRLPDENELKISNDERLISELYSK